MSNEKQQKAVYLLFCKFTLHASGIQPHPSSGVHKTVTTASGTCHIFCAPETCGVNFDVLMTVHLSISVFNQLDAQNLFHKKFYFIPLHVSSTCAHHQEVKIALHSLWYHHTYRWPFTARVEIGLQSSAAFYHRGRPGAHFTGGCMRPRAGLDRCGKSRLHRNSIPGPSSP